MTTPTSAELRAWARDNGHTVASRGRVSDDVRSAWQKAHTPRRKRRPGPSRVSSSAAALTGTPLGASPDEGQSVSDMAEQLAALTARVDKLETQLASKPDKKRKKKKS